MTIREIAEFTGKTERSVQRWVIKASDKMSSIYDKMSGTSTPKGKADYDIMEVEKILRQSSMSHDAVTILMFNAKESQKVATSKGIELPLQNAEVMQMFQLIMHQQQQFMTAVIGEMKSLIKPELKTHEQLLIESVPEKPPRAIFIQKMNRYMELTRYTPREAYHFVYDEIGAIYTIRIMARAKKRNCTGVDVLESDGYLGKGIAVIINLIKALEEGV